VGALDTTGGEWASGQRRLRRLPRECNGLFLRPKRSRPSSKRRAGNSMRFRLASTSSMRDVALLIRMSQSGFVRGANVSEGRLAGDHRWSPRAIAHLAEPRGRIARDNPNAANRVVRSELQQVDARSCGFSRRRTVRLPCSSSTSATNRLGNIPRRAATSCWLDPAEAAMTRRAQPLSKLRRRMSSNLRQRNAGDAPSLRRRSSAGASVELCPAVLVQYRNT
jgi:hypothetical protein